MLAFELCIVRTGPISTLRTRKSVAREEIRDVLADFTLHRYLSQWDCACNSPVFSKSSLSRFDISSGELEGEGVMSRSIRAPSRSINGYSVLEIFHVAGNWPTHLT